MNKTYKTNLDEDEALALFRTNVELLGESLSSVLSYVAKTDSESAMIIVESDEHNKSFSQLRKSLKEVYDLPEIEKKQDVGNIRKHAVSLLANGKNSAGEQYKTTKIGPITKSGHQVSYFYPKPDKDADYPDTQRYLIAHKDNVPHVVVKMDAEVPGKPVFKIGALSKTDDSNGIMAHEVYNHLLQHGPTGTTLVSTAQSAGGKSVWQRLAKTKGVSVHGFDPETNEVYNTDKHLDSDYDHETHADPRDKESHVGGENNKVLNRWLVASKLNESTDIDKGAFHRYLGKPEDAPITDDDIEKGLLSDDEHVHKMAQFAKNMKPVNVSFTSESFRHLREMVASLTKDESI